MGFFSRLFQKDKPSNFKYQPTTEHEAWVGILYACMAADDDISAAETTVLTRLLALKTQFIGIDILPFYQKAALAYKHIGCDGIVDACCPFISKDFRPTLFAMSTEVILADGKFEQEEKQILAYLGNSLNISPSMYKKIIEVIMIKTKSNRILP